MDTTYDIPYKNQFLCDYYVGVVHPLPRHVSRVLQ